MVSNLTIVTRAMTVLEFLIDSVEIKYSYVHMKPLQSMFMKRNEVVLTRQNPPLKCCQLLELWTQLKKDLDLSMLKI